MTFWRRLRMFMVGVGLGLIIVYFYFGDRELGQWTPNSRVFAAIDSAEVVISAKAICQLECLEISQEQVDSLFKSSKVEFSESYAQAKPCPSYLLKNKKGDAVIEMFWEVCESSKTAELLRINREGVSCDCP